MKIEERQRMFKQPSREFKGKPFWSWNGKLEEGELKRQIDIMEEMGFGGYFMHSRTGLETEYLGDEWFRLTRECADYGDKKGLESWLYDEDRWPSGSAGGLVTKEEKYRAMYLSMDIAEQEYAFMEWDESVTAVFACRLLGESYFDHKRRLYQGDALQDGEKALIFRTQYMPSNDNYNGYTYLDTMSKEAVERYLEITHEQYKTRCGEKFGKEITGIFTDEPHRGCCFTDFADGKINQAPYTPVLFEEFERRFGYNMKEYLPDIFLRKKDTNISKVTRDYFELCQSLFLENFAIPIYHWCRENKLIFTGHVLHEDSLCAQAIMQGSLMRFYEYMDYPGVDVLTESNECYWIVKQVDSVARQLNKKWILSELYGCTGWQMNFESYKNIGDWQALFGINLRCPHLSWYTMKGEAKRDYPASILHQSPWYHEYNYLEDYYSRIHAALFEGKPVCNLLVINPIESIWARAYSGAFTGLQAEDPKIIEREKQYEDIFHWLAGSQIDFDYGEEDIIARHARIEDGILYVGEAAYHKVLIAGIDTIRSSTVKLLEEFRQKGGEVIFAGEIPVYVDAEPSNKGKELSERCMRIPLNESSIVTACSDTHKITIHGEESHRIYVQSRRMEEGRMIMLLNMDREKAHKNIRLVLGAGGYLEQWDPRSGNIVRPEYTKNNEMIETVIDLEAGGERLFFLSDTDRGTKKAECFIEKEEAALPEQFSYRLTEKNICVLDQVKILLEDGQMIPKQEVLKADRRLRDILSIPHRSGEMLQPWYEMKFGDGYKKRLTKISSEYEVEAERVPTSVALIIEDLEHISSIQLNGTYIPLTSQGKWIDICFDRIDIPDELWQEGVNYITIVSDYYKTSGMEAIYLHGDFGVELQAQKNAVLTSLPSKLSIGDISMQGLPFYSGSIIYETEGFEGKTLSVTANNFGGALIKLLGKEDAIIAFPPHKSIVEDLTGIEVILTRRNTFGPLHQLPKRAHAYGPNNFTTEGEAFSEEYQLYEQGLLKEPSIYFV